MSRGITLSQKHGVNPTIACCFFCGKPKNEIAFLGRYDRTEEVRTAYGGTSKVVVERDVEAPKYSILNYEPCDECKEQFSQGVPVIEATTFQPSDGRPAISKDEHGNPVYPTGNVVVMRFEAAQRVFKGITVKMGSPVLLEDKVFSQMFEGMT